jgi:hypothetical protein
MPTDVRPKARSKVLGLTISYDLGSVVDHGIETRGRRYLCGTDATCERKATTEPPINVEFDALEHDATAGERPPDRATRGSHR